MEEALEWEGYRDAIARLLDDGCPHDLPIPVNPELMRGRLLIFDVGCDPRLIAYNNVRSNEG